MTKATKAVAAMQRSNLPLIIGGALLLYALYANSQQQQAPAPEPTPVVKPAPKPKPKQQPNCPSWGMTFQAPSSGATNGKPQLGGLVSPDGLVHAVALPEDLQWPENISSPPRTALGCCGFRVTDYQARFQNYPPLVDLPEKMVKAHIPGGAYPQKWESVIHRFAPDATFFNDTTKSWEILEQCVKSQRLPAVDYNGHDPHYRMQIAHCVNVVACDRDMDWVAILDNNHPTTDEIVWMSCAEFSKRWGGWCYCLLNVAPGHCAGSHAAEKMELLAADDGTYNYGLDRKGASYPGASRLNGEASSVAEILSAIGPAMAPIKVEVDHKVEAPGLSVTPLMIALAGGAILLFSTLSQRKE